MVYDCRLLEILEDMSYDYLFITVSERFFRIKSSNTRKSSAFFKFIEFLSYSSTSQNLLFLSKSTLSTPKMLPINVAFP